MHTVCMLCAVRHHIVRTNYGAKTTKNVAQNAADVTNELYISPAVEQIGKPRQIGNNNYILLKVIEAYQPKQRQRQ